jgi:nicotinate-nucleotide adenylyltransferase
LAAGTGVLMARLKIGLLGGSFNPAHEGHRHISLLALKQLRLDQVWWLVSPQNPLKASDKMSPLSQRMAGARALARHPRILVSDLESRLGTRYTADTLARLRRRYREHGFVWLMGADNLVQLPQWRRWHEIVEMTPMAIFNRPGQGPRALTGPAAARYARYRVSRPAELPLATAPAWCFLFSRLHPASSTAIRAVGTNIGKDA